MAGYDPLIVKDDRVLLLDQRRLPATVEYMEAKSLQDICFAIKEMVVRGAPLIGIVAAFGVYLGIRDSYDKVDFKNRLKNSKEALSKTRPTAVNLFFALDRMESVAKEKLDILPLQKLINKMRATAFALWDEQKKQDKLIGSFGADYLKGKKRILTHCNTGTLATGGIGTALGIIKTMHERGQIELVYVDETRPYLQGSRLTAFELQQEGIGYRVVTDNSCGMLMRKGIVDAVIVGADRIAKNGDVANKIGTYCLAVMAKKHGIPFVVAAPESTIDRSIASMREISIEERSSDEVLRIGDVDIAPPGSKALHYAFDLTDADLISAIITENGVYEEFDF